MRRSTIGVHWRKAATKQLTAFGKDGHPKALMKQSVLVKGSRALL